MHTIEEVNVHAQCSLLLQLLWTKVFQGNRDPLYHLYLMKIYFNWPCNLFLSLKLSVVHYHADFLFINSEISIQFGSSFNFSPVVSGGINFLGFCKIVSFTKHNVVEYWWNQFVVIVDNVDKIYFIISAHTETAGNESMTMAAEVGLLTRNIRVEGASYNKLYSQSFGARIMVSQTQDPTDSNRLLVGEE